MCIDPAGEEAQTEVDWKAKATALEDDLRSKTGELQGLHTEIEL